MVRARAIHNSKPAERFRQTVTTKAVTQKLKLAIHILPPDLFELGDFAGKRFKVRYANGPLVPWHGLTCH